MRRSEPVWAGPPSVKRLPRCASSNLRKSEITPVVSLGELEVEEPIAETLIDMISSQCRTAYAARIRDQTLSPESLDARYSSARGTSIRQVATEIFERMPEEAKNKLSESAVLNCKREVIENALKAFRADVKEWAADYKHAVETHARQIAPCPSLGAEQLERLETDSFDTADWEYRLNATEQILNDVCCAFKKFRGADDILMYPVDGSLAGVLLADFSKNVPEVSWLVTHPGSANAGGALIEQAVAVSIKAGKHGKLTLSPFDETCREIYRELGFVSSAVDLDMFLDPATSEKWKKVGEEWKLIKYANKKYVG